MSESARWKTPASMALIKGMILRGDPHSEISAWFDNVNQGRIGEISNGMKPLPLPPGTVERGRNIAPAPPEELPPGGPPPVLRVITDDLIRSVLEEAAPVVGQWRDHVAKTHGEDAAQSVKMLLTRLHVALDQRKREVVYSMMTGRRG